MDKSKSCRTDNDAWYRSYLEMLRRMLDSDNSDTITTISFKFSLVLQANITHQSIWSRQSIQANSLVELKL